MLSLSASSPFRRKSVKDVTGPRPESAESASCWMLGVNDVSAGFCRHRRTAAGIFPLDFAHVFRYSFTNTPASPLPLRGEAHLGQVFLCAVGTALPQSEVSP